MRIEEIQIRNFKGFKDDTFRLNPHFTVFIGDNAKGKTSVLDALSVAIGSFFLGIDVASQRGIYKKEIRTATIEGQVKPQLPVVIKAIGTVNNQEIEWIRDIDKFSAKNQITTRDKDSKAIKQIAIQMLAKSRTEGGVIFPVLAYHGTGRLWAEHDSVSYKKDDEGVEMAYKNCLSAKSSSREFLTWYKTFEDEVHKFGQQQDKLLLEAFKQAIISMIPNAAWSDMAFSFKDNDLVGIFTESNGNKEKLLFKQLSDGYRNMIGMVADIAYRCIKLNPHLGSDVINKTPGVVLIDEIDLHIHPKWQKRMVDDLKRTFPEIQFIATTHSPFIVQSLQSDELYILDRTVEEAPTKYPIADIATYFMGVDSEYSMENQATYEASKDFLSSLNTDISSEELDQKLEKISDPALRAFLELNKLAKKR